MRYPLADRWGMCEADCLALCYRKGNEWVEGGVRLYDVLDRVSCWCCRNKNMRELSAMRKNLPNYFERLVALERAIGEPMKKNHVLCPGQNTTETERITKSSRPMRRPGRSALIARSALGAAAFRATRKADETSSRALMRGNHPTTSIRSLRPCFTEGRGMSSQSKMTRLRS